MEYVIRLEQLSSRPLAVVRRLATSQELARVVPEACGAVWSVIRAQEIFWDDDSVFFASIHQWGIFPGTGGADEF